MEESIEGLLAKYALGDLLSKAPTKKGIDFTTGKEVDLTDPSTYTTVTVEPAEPPKGAQVVDVGRDLNRGQRLVGEDVGKNPFLDVLRGLLDYKSSSLFNPLQAVLPRADYDKKGDFFGENPLSGYGRKWDQEKETRLKEEKRKADIASGRSLPSLEEAAESEQYKDFVFNRERERYNQVIQDQLAYAIENNPKLARAMLPVLTEARRTSEGMPSSIQARMYLSALGAKAGGDRISNMVNSARDAAKVGYDRYSGIRVT